MGDPVPGGQLGIADLHAEAVHHPTARADEEGARLPHQPGPQRATLGDEARRRVDLARPVADQVAEQPQRGALRRLVPPARRGRTTLAPRWA